MSLPRETILTCDRCQNKQSFIAWETLNATINRSEKEQLLKGHLTRFTCCKCGLSKSVGYPLLYHDMEKRFMVWLWPGAGDPDLQRMPIAGLKGYRFRLVKSRNELVEKVLIFDDALDDRVVEFLKILLWAQALEGLHPLNGKMLFNGIEQAKGSDMLIRFEHLNDDGSESFTASMESYRQLAESLAPRLSDEGAEAGNWLKVTQEYAKSLAPPH